jgi:hypothetical protein
MADKLTQEIIEGGMAWAEKVACRPVDDRCLPLPDDVENARQTCTPKGRCKIGWIVADAGTRRRCGGPLPAAREMALNGADRRGRED